MNKTQAKKLGELAFAFQQAVDTDAVANLQGELQDKYDAMSENAQESDTGQKLQSEISALEELHTALEQASELFDQLTAE